MKNRHDHYFRKAKQQDFAARSVYKIEEIDRKHGLIRPGNAVLDLGCRPGSWMQYAARKVGSRGKVVGIDLRSVERALPDNCVVLQMDAERIDLAVLSGHVRRFQVVLSDMAPDTTGVKFVDQVRSMNLCEAALAAARRLLSPGGHFVTKIFQGPGFEEFLKDVRRSFRKVHVVKPKSSRKESKEIYVVGKGYRAQSEAKTDQEEIE